MGGNFAILNPCVKKWADLQGDGRARFCETCQTHVHSIADYSPSEWNRLWRESKGHVCGYLSADLPARPRSRRAILVGALLAAVSPLFAANGRVRFRVKDPTGALVQDAEVTLGSKTLRTEKNGEVLWTDLPLGNSVFVFSALDGFLRRTIPITIHNSKELRVEVFLRAPSVGETVSVPIKPEKRHGWLIYWRAANAAHFAIRFGRSPFRSLRT